MSEDDFEQVLGQDAEDIRQDMIGAFADEYDIPDPDEQTKVRITLTVTEPVVGEIGTVIRNPMEVLRNPAWGLFFQDVIYQLAHGSAHALARHKGEEALADECQEKPAERFFEESTAGHMIAEFEVIQEDDS